MFSRAFEACSFEGWELALSKALGMRGLVLGVVLRR